MQTKAGTKLSPWLLAALLTVLFLALAALFLFVVNRWQLQVLPRGGAELTLEYGAPYQETGAEARLIGTLLLPRGVEVPVATAGEVDAGTLGDYSVTYTAEKLLWRGQAVRRVHVVDTTPPELTLVSAPGAHTRPGAVYAEEGYSAWDSHDGDLTGAVACLAETEQITYSVTDQSGNTATAVRPIVYGDEAPVLTLLGGEELVIGAAPRFTDPGCTAMDDFDGELTGQVTVEGQVIPWELGEYTLRYTVADSAGRVAEALRHVTVEAVPQPETVTPEGRVVYLTFDDGPGPDTPRLLDVLDSYGVKATFFVTGLGNRSLFSEIVARGHSIGIHCYNHNYKQLYVNEATYFEDLAQMQDAVYEQTGVRTTLVRFPGGSSNTSSCFNPGIMTRLTNCLHNMGLQYFDWNVTGVDTASYAWRESVFEYASAGILRNDERGVNVSIVLEHDIRSFTPEAVDLLLAWGTERGYTFLPLEASSPAVHHALAN